MKIDFGAKLIGYDGEVVRTQERAWEKDSPLIDMTLGIASVRALTAGIQEERIQGEEKFKRGELARRIYNSSGDIDISVEDAAIIKKLIGAVFLPTVVEASWPILDGKGTASS